MSAATTSIKEFHDLFKNYIEALEARVVVLEGLVTNISDGSGAISIPDTTDPVSNPAANYSRIYTDAAGALKTKNAAGTVFTYNHA